MEPEISVVIAVRNAAATLQKALLSIQNQSLSAKEILLVLNGCSDETPTLARELAHHDHRVRILESSQAGGVAEAAQLGCHEAKYPLIARMDADDVADSERFENQLRVWKETQADLVTCRVRAFHSLGQGMERFVNWANELQTPTDFQRERFVESPVIQPGVLMTKDCLLYTSPSPRDRQKSRMPSSA